MFINAFGNTHIGMIRSNNEDAFGVYPDLSLYVVADGLGGHAGGEIASRIAVEAIRDNISSGFEKPAEMEDNLRETIKGANTLINRLAKKEQDLHGMGTTVVVAKIEGTWAIVAHVGDSRAYLVRGDGFTQVTKDHTVVEEYVRLGLLTPQDAQYHPYRHVLSRALGISGDVEVDVADIQIQSGDTIILCTDGLTNMVPDKEIFNTVSELRPSPRKITETLIARANQNGGIDNITVIAICIEK